MNKRQLKVDLKNLLKPQYHSNCKHLTIQKKVAQISLKNQVGHITRKQLPLRKCKSQIKIQLTSVIELPQLIKAFRSNSMPKQYAQKILDQSKFEVLNIISRYKEMCELNDQIRNLGDDNLVNQPAKLYRPCDKQRLLVKSLLAKRERMKWKSQKALSSRQTDKFLKLQQSIMRQRYTMTGSKKWYYDLKKLVPKMDQDLNNDTQKNIREFLLKLENCSKEEQELLKIPNFKIDQKFLSKNERGLIQKDRRILLTNLLSIVQKKYETGLVTKIWSKHGLGQQVTPVNLFPGNDPKTYSNQFQKNQTKRQSTRNNPQNALESNWNEFNSMIEDLELVISGDQPMCDQKDSRGQKILNFQIDKSGLQKLKKQFRNAQAISLRDKVNSHFTNSSAFEKIQDKLDSRLFERCLLNMYRKPQFGSKLWKIDSLLNQFEAEHFQAKNFFSSYSTRCKQSVFSSWLNQYGVFEIETVSKIKISVPKSLCPSKEFLIELQKGNHKKVSKAPYKLLYNWKERIEDNIKNAQTIANIMGQANSNTEHLLNVIVFSSRLRDAIFRQLNIKVSHFIDFAGDNQIKIVEDFSAMRVTISNIGRKINCILGNYNYYRVKIGRQTIRLRTPRDSTASDQMELIQEYFDKPFGFEQLAIFCKNQTADLIKSSEKYNKIRITEQSKNTDFHEYFKVIKEKDNQPDYADHLTDKKTMFTDNTSVIFFEPNEDSYEDNDIFELNISDKKTKIPTFRELKIAQFFEGKPDDFLKNKQ